MNNIKIVHVIPTLGVGGAENFVVSLCSTFDFSLCDVTIISFKDDISNANKELLSKTPIKIIFLHKKKGFSVSFVKRFKKALLNENADVINCHLHTIFYANMFIKKLHNPIYYTVHTIDNAELRKAYQRIIRKNVQKSRIVLIGISHLVSLSICRLYNIKHCETIYNGIVIPKIVNNDVKKKSFDFINVGRFAEVKNQRLLLEAFDKVYETDHNLKLLIVGQGDLYGELLKYKKSLPSANNISFVTDCDSPSNYYLSSKIFVLSSIFEGNPISALEAMSYGLPVISTSVGGVPDVIKDGVNGILVSSNDVEGLSNAMIELINNNDIYNTISKNNKELIKRYDIKNTAKSYYNCYMDSLRKNNKI
jgi:glycosyltransferase involved in cell wall biosynthesis